MGFCKKEATVCGWPTCGQSKGEHDPDVLFSLSWVARRAVLRFGFIFFLHNHILFSPYQTRVPLRRERESKWFLYIFSASTVLDLKFCNLIHPKVLYNILYSPVVLFSISLKSSNESVKLRPSDGTSVNDIKGYGKNLLLATQHASSFLVTIPCVPVGNYQLRPVLSHLVWMRLSPTLAPQWVFINLNRSVPDS